MQQARELQIRLGPLDLHVDSILQRQLFRYDLRKRHRAGMLGQPMLWHADIPRMIEAGYSGACMGIHAWPWESEGGWRAVNRQLDYLDQLTEAEPRCLRVRTHEDWQTARERGLLALGAGIEGAHCLCGRIDRVEHLAQRNVAYLTLAHFSRNAAATPSLGRGANERDALTPFGQEVVKTLNRLGVAVDVAHVNTPGVLEACAITHAPLLCTHTGVKGVHDHARNISDTEIDAISATDGVIGIMFAPLFLAGTRKADSRTVAEHIDYVVQRVGIRHVGWGSDYDGWIPIPIDQRDCTDSVRVTHSLHQLGYDETALAALMRNNVLRVMSTVRESARPPD